MHLDGDAGDFLGGGVEQLNVWGEGSDVGFFREVEEHAAGAIFFRRGSQSRAKHHAVTAGDKLGDFRPGERAGNRGFGLAAGRNAEDRVRVLM